MQPTEAFVTKHQARAAKAPDVKELVDKLASIISGDHQFAQEIIALLAAACNLPGSNPVGAAPAKPLVQPGGTYFARVFRFFQLTANEWASVSEMAAGIGVRNQRLANLLYATHRDKFEQRQDPKAPNRRQWRIVPQLMDSLTRMGGDTP